MTHGFENRNDIRLDTIVLFCPILKTVLVCGSFDTEVSALYLILNRWGQVDPTLVESTRIRNVSPSLEFSLSCSWLLTSPAISR